MALDVYLQKDNNLPHVGGEQKHIISFEDDGYFSFLYDLFKELETKTGQVIETYEDAFFSGELLDSLTETVFKAKDLVSQQPEVWEEFIGTILHDVKGKDKIEKIYTTVYKEKLMLKLEQLENAIKEAKEKNLGIFFFGD